MELLIEAEAHITKGNYAKALVALTEAANNPFLRAAALRQRGKLYFDLKKYKKSVADYTEAISTKAPGIQGIRAGHLLRARAALAMADYNLALDDIQNLLKLALKQDPDQVQDVVDLIDELLEPSKDHPLTKAESERVSTIVKFISSKIFNEERQGQIWAENILKQLAVRG